jgi:hypothetical protein
MQPYRVRGPAEDREGRVARQDFGGQENHHGYQQQRDDADGGPADDEGADRVSGRARRARADSGSGYRHGALTGSVVTG